MAIEAIFLGRSMRFLTAKLVLEILMAGITEVISLS